MGPHLTKLPEELIVEILQYLPVSKGLLNIYRVCRQFHVLGFGRLYSRIEVLANPLDGRLCASIHSVDSHFNMYYKHEKHNKDLVKLVTYVQDHTRELLGDTYNLLKPHTTHAQEAPPDLFRLLETMGGGFRHFHIFHQPRYSSIPHSVGLHNLHNIGSLDLYLVCEDDCGFAGGIMQRLPNLRRLSITTHDLDDDLQPYAAPVFRHVFPGLSDPLHPRTKLTLTTLRLISINSPHIGPLLAAAIDIPRLTTLELLYCTGAQELLTSFGSAELALVNFACHFGYITSTPKRFLLSCKGLRNLQLSNTVPALTENGYSEAITRFGPDLRILWLDDASCLPETQQHEGEMSILDVFRTIFTKCPNLEQVAIRLPDLYIDDFCRSLQTLQALDKLVYLRLKMTTRVIDAYYGQVVMTTYEHDKIEEEMSIRADLVSMILRDTCPNLVALQIDACGPILRVGDRDELRSFVFARESRASPLVPCHTAPNHQLFRNLFNDF